MQPIVSYVIATGLENQPFTLVLVRIHTDEVRIGDFISTLFKFDALKKEPSGWCHMLKGRDSHYVEQICRQMTARMVRVSEMDQTIPNDRYQEVKLHGTGGPDKGE